MSSSAAHQARLVEPMVFRCNSCQRKIKAQAPFAGKKVKCPHCSQVMAVPPPNVQHPNAVAAQTPTPAGVPSWCAGVFRDLKRLPILSALLLLIFVFGCSAYANASRVITNKANLKYLPPYKAYVNANGNNHLGGEYYQMAHALLAGKGFSDPFAQPTGPTAWQPPILPLILAGLLWATDGSRDATAMIVVVMQDFILAGTTFIVLALVMQTTRYIATAFAALVCAAALAYDFRLYFQFTHDWWIVLLFVDLLVAGLCWCKPLQGWKSAAAWGIFGGLCAMVNPIVGMTWLITSTFLGVRQCSWLRLGVMFLTLAVTLAPWTIRNYLVFGRFIPSKSNLAFELYQSQVLQKNGLLLKFVKHPFGVTNSDEGRKYKELGETAYLDLKKQQYLESIAADPVDFLDRLAARFAGATLWYVPFHRGEGMRWWELWICRLTHPLPFLAFLFLLYSSFWKPLHALQWTIIAVYVLYLGPYIGASYYDRYAIPILAMKVLFVLWALDRLLLILLGRSSNRKRSAESASSETSGESPPTGLSTAHASPPAQKNTA